MPGITRLRRYYAPNPHLRSILVGLLLAVTGWSFSLWQKCFEEPELDILLVAPLRETQTCWFDATL